jgi:hypothetical protein
MSYNYNAMERPKAMLQWQMAKLKWLDIERAEFLDQSG